MRGAFTLIEVIVVVVIIGILASIALPKLGVTANDAKIAKAKSEIAAVRAGIALAKNANLLNGVVAYPDATLNGGASPLEDGECCFGFVLETPLKSPLWSLTADTYTLTIGSLKTTFTYNATDGKFACDIGETLCKSVDYK